MKINLLIFILCLQQLLFAQKEGNIWYFGKNAGIDFNSGVPVALKGGALSTREGCASICNAKGEILFYTDGISVWDRNHKIMPNGTGLNGDPSSTQSAIIVKKPGINSIYFIFTVAELAELNGVQYSEIDMSLNSGLGNVNTTKNHSLLSPSCEKITAIRHQNQSDYWIVTKLYNSNAFHSYLLSATGINTIPEKSFNGTIVTVPTHTLGYLKSSPDGKKLLVQIIDLEKLNSLILTIKLAA